jgi:hypothetical protein
MATLKKTKLAVILVLVFFPAVLQAAFEVKRILDEDIGAPILDVATNPADETVFVLTPGAVLIYSTADRVVLERIALQEPFDRIAYQDDDRLVLSASQSSRIRVLHFNRIYDIDLSGRALKGPRDAKVSLVVFDDYQ